MRSAVSAMLVTRMVVVAMPRRAATPSACRSTGSCRSMRPPEGPNGCSVAVTSASAESLMARAAVVAAAGEGVDAVDGAGVGRGRGALVVRCGVGGGSGTACTGMKAIHTHASSIISRPSR